MPELIDTAQQVVGWAADDEQVEAYVVRGSETEARAYKGDVESFTQADSAGIGIRIVRDGRIGFAYAGALDDDLVREAFAEARDNASYGTPDEHAALAEPDGVAPPPIEIWSDALVGFPTSSKVDLALDLDKRLRDADPRISEVDLVLYADNFIESAVATTTGIAASQRRTRCQLVALCIAGEGDDRHTGYGYVVGQEPGELDPEEVVRDAVNRSTRMLGAVKPKTAKLPIVFDTRVTVQFLSALSATLNGENVLKGRSFLAGRVGETVGATNLTLVEDPTDERAYGAGHYDAEGLASRRVELVRDGVLQGFLYDSYSARRAGTTSTASAARSANTTPGVSARALQLTPGTRSQDELLADLGDTLLVLGVTGMNSGVNPISGDFSVGCEGLLYRSGQDPQPVRELTVASTMQRMLQDVVAVGNDVEWLPGAAAGVSLAIADVSIGGL